MRGKKIDFTSLVWYPYYLISSVLFGEFYLFLSGVKVVKIEGVKEL